MCMPTGLLVWFYRCSNYYVRLVTYLSVIILLIQTYHGTLCKDYTLSLLFLKPCHVSLSRYTMLGLF
jgi:hypothetical protein